MTQRTSAALEVILHAAKRKKKGKNPSLRYKDERNPRKALLLALSDRVWELKIPAITDELLAQRMEQIKYVRPAMQGVDGVVHTTDEEDEKYFDLFYVETKVNPRSQAFNFDEDRKLTTKAVGLQKLLVKDIFVRVGGYYGFCKVSFAEVMSQVPTELAATIVAFAINPKESAVNLNDDYQSISIIFYGKSQEDLDSAAALPSVEGLIKTVDFEKARKLRGKVKPIINWAGEGYTFFEPEKIDEPFMNVGIWLAVNGSHLLKHNSETPVSTPCKLGEKAVVYQSFDELADFFKPDYAYTISQIPDELINENTIGFMYNTVDYFRTKEGVIHRAEYTMVEAEKD